MVELTHQLFKSDWIDVAQREMLLDTIVEALSVLKGGLSSLHPALESGEANIFALKSTKERLKPHSCNNYPSGSCSRCVQRESEAPNRQCSYSVIHDQRDVLSQTVG